MKRHLLGFALFNLIVGTALIVAILTGSFSKPPATYTYDVSKQSCWKNVRQNSINRKNYETSRNSIKVTQAIFNEKTRKMNISFLIERETPATQDVKVKLIFANAELKDRAEWQTDFKTDYVDFTPNFNVDNKAFYSMTYRLPKNLKSNGNLYIAAELGDGSLNDSNFISRKVDYSDFSPILLTDKNF